MCGRYFFHIENHPVFSKLQKKIEQASLFEYAKEEVFPSQDALVLIQDKQDYQVDVMTWGVEGYNSTRLINARSETIHQKKTFIPMLGNRCLIPCNGFFEWVKTKQGKQKVFIHKTDAPLIYLAGIYNEKKEFTIVTGEAQYDMKKIHDRTPIIIQEEQIPRYLQQSLDFEVDNEDLQFQEVKKK